MQPRSFKPNNKRKNPTTESTQFQLNSVAPNRVFTTVAATTSRIHATTTEPQKTFRPLWIKSRRRRRGEKGRIGTWKQMMSASREARRRRREPCWATRCRSPFTLYVTIFMVKTGNSRVRVRVRDWFEERRTTQKTKNKKKKSRRRGVVCFG